MKLFLQLVTFMVCGLSSHIGAAKMRLPPHPVITPLENSVSAQAEDGSYSRGAVFRVEGARNDTYYVRSIYKLRLKQSNRGMVEVVADIYEAIADEFMIQIPLRSTSGALDSQDVAQIKAWLAPLVLEQEPKRLIGDWYLIKVDQKSARAHDYVRQLELPRFIQNLEPNLIRSVDIADRKDQFDPRTIVSVQSR